MLFEYLSDGKMYIVGNFTTVNGVARKEIARLNADGSLDTSFNADWLGGAFNQGINIMAIKALPDGKILVAGDMPFDGNSGPRRVKRLNADGSADATLTATPRIDWANNSSEEINSLAQLPNGKILVCGDFDLANNNPEALLARYNNDGTYDATLATTLNGTCRDIEAFPNGKYIVAGAHTTVNGNSSAGLVRFNADDSVDSGFIAPSFGGAPVGANYVKLLGDGSMLAYLVHATGNRAVRLNADGSLRLILATDEGALIEAAVQPNGKTLLSIQDNFRRVNTDGTYDPSLGHSGILDWYGSGLSNRPYEPRGMAFTVDGKLILAGTFTSFDNPSGTGPFIDRAYLARFTLQAIPFKHRYDFDGDGKDDIAVFRPSDRVWHVNRSTAGYTSVQFGLSTDTPIAYDHDGDQKADIAVFRDGAWYWLRSIDGVFAYKVIGQAGDIPQPSNFNAYGLVFRPSVPSFYTQQPFQNATPVSFPNMTLQATDKPIVADYDGDGREDMAVFRDGNWFIRKGFTNTVIHYQFGLPGDKAVPADYDGDGRADYAVYRPSEGIWYINRTNDGFFAMRWGIEEDIPVPADYNGDGKADIAVFRPSDGNWYQFRSDNTAYIEHFGLSGDIPVQLR